MFKIELLYNKTLSINKHKCDFDFKNDLEDITSLFYHICESISSEKGVEFRIQGFYKDKWNTLKNIDLYIFLEQFYELIKFTNNINIYSIDISFPEQHLQRYLKLKKIDLDTIEISCSSGLDIDSPITENEVVLIEYLSKELFNIFESFLNIVKDICPQTYHNSIFISWVNRINIIKANYK